jgi:hypothetical protein
MANTYVDYTAVAAQTDYNFSFEYLRDEHVKVKVNGSEVTNFTIVTSPVQLIRFDTAPVANADIKIYRDSRGDFSPLVDFVDGSILTENELDEGYKHNLFLSQEASEGTGGEQLTKKGLEHYDAEGNKIINLFAPSDNTDAANKAYVDQTIDTAIALDGSPAIVSLGGYDVTAFGTSITKSLANWTNDLNSPTATGTTTARTLADRFADVVNVKDFGAVGDGVTDDRAAIQDANNYAASAGLPLYFPGGTYGVSVGYTSNFDIGVSGTSAPSLSATTSWASSSKATIKQLNTFNVGHSGANHYLARIDDKSNILFKNIVFDAQCTAKGATTNTDGSLFSTTTNNDRHARFDFTVTAGVITAITVLDGAYGYTAGKIVHDASNRVSYKDFILPTQSSGSGLDADYTVDSNGTVTGVTINNGGSGYPASISTSTGNILDSAAIERNWSNGSLGFLVRNCSDITFENCEFNNTLRSGLRIDCHGSTTGLNADGRRFGNIILSNCKSNRHRGEFGDGFYVAGVDNVQHSNCYSYDAQRINFVVELSGSLVCENVNYVNCTAEYAHHHTGEQHNVGFWVESGTDIKYTNCTAKNVYGGFTFGTGLDITKDAPIPDVVSIDFINCKVDDSTVGWRVGLGSQNSTSINMSNCSALIDPNKGRDWMSGHTNAYPTHGSWAICSGLIVRGSTDATVDQVINLNNFNVEIINDTSDHTAGGPFYAGLLDEGFSSVSGSKRILNIDGFYTKYRSASNARTQMNKAWDTSTDALSDGTPFVGDIVFRGRALAPAQGSDYYLTASNLVNLSTDYFGIIGSAGFGTGEVVGAFFNEYYISNSNVFLNIVGTADRLYFENCPLLDWKEFPSNVVEVIIDNCVLQHTSDNSDNNTFQSIRTRFVNSTIKRKLRLRPIYQPSDSGYRVSHIFENNSFEFDYTAAQIILEQSSYDGTKKFNLIFKNNLFHDLGTGGDRSVIETSSTTVADASLYRIYGTGNLVDSRINKIGLWTYNSNDYHISDIGDLELILTSTSTATGTYIYGNQAGGNTVFAESIVLT